MRIIEVIEARRWKHTTSGRTASIYGAMPYTSQDDKPNWTIETIGYTWRTSDHTIGMGKVPAKTREEAQAYMDDYNARMDALRGN